MKKLFMIIAVIASAILTSCKGNEVASIDDPSNLFSEFKDPVLKKACERFDMNANGKLSKTECEAVIDLKLIDNEKFQPKTRSLVGISYFKNMTEIVLIETDVESVDLSSNKKIETVMLRDNQRLKLVDVKSNEKLKNFYCILSQVETIDLSNHESLDYVDCSKNISLTKIDLRGCKKITRLFCLNNKPGLKILVDKGFDEKKLIVFDVKDATLIRE